MPPILPGKTALTIVTLGAISITPMFVPYLKNYKMFDWTAVSTVTDFVPRASSKAPIEQEHHRLRPQTDPASYGAHRILDPHNALDGFYAALLRAGRREDGAVARILHYGDSPTTADLITADVRALLQQRFGDAGHGFCLIAKPWEWYSHRGVDYSASGWEIDPANNPNIRDGYFGLGGVSFRGGEEASARIRMRGGHSRLEISYLKQPDGGKLIVETEGKVAAVIDTAGDAIEPGFAGLPIPPGAQNFTIRPSSGRVRLFGVLFEKSTSGVVYNSLGLNGAYASVLAKMIDEKHWAAQLRHYRPDLIIINYGTNESVYPEYVDRSYEREMKQVVRRVRAAVPSASILVMSPMDRGQREEGGDIGTVPVMSRLVNLQQRVASETGCAYFNTFQAMGGPGTMGRWYMAEPRLVSSDFIHPMPAGAKIVGSLLYQALMDGYNRYRLRHVQHRFAKMKQ